jgi:HEXXH motif-containing protein
LTLITNHSLSADAFMALADGAGDSVVVRQLREAQLSKHLMLLHVVDYAAAVGPSSPATAAFRVGYQLLAEAQASDPGAVARLLALPHIGGWAHDCLACLDDGSAPDFGYLATVAAAAAVRAGTPFQMDAPVLDGRVQLPGLGCLQVPHQGEWIGISSDGERLRAGDQIDLACADLVPDDGKRHVVPHWRGTPMVTSVTEGQTWEVLLETDDRHLDRYKLPMLSGMTAAEIRSWRQRIQAAWELLVRHHQWAAGPIAEGVSVIVPLARRSAHDSATSPAAFGAIATSLPSSPVIMAETLVHEFQHIKLCGLMDMLPLIEPSDERGYAPWRDDPRPIGGILQGVYAYTGIVRFWDVQRQVETEPDAVLCASVQYERWRLAIQLVTETLVDKGLLTPAGVRFVTAPRERGRRPESAPVSPEAMEIARDVALDHRLTWQMMYTSFDANAVARLAAAYQRGMPRNGQDLPEARIGENEKTINSIPRSRLLIMRYQDPPRFRQLIAAGSTELDAADSLLICGDAVAAVAAYCTRLTAEPDPGAWIGLALAAHRLPAPPSLEPFAVHLRLLFEIHAFLASSGIQADPLELAAWFE